MSGIGIIVAVIVAVVVVMGLLALFVVRRARVSKGGVQPPPEETGRRHPGNPPLESIEPRS